MIAIVALLAVVVGLAFTSPSVAQAVMPAAVLPHLPQFEAETTGVSCDAVERVESGEETIRDIFGAEGDPQTRDAACNVRCPGDDTYAGDYCSDGEFVCVCQVESGSAGSDSGFSLPGMNDSGE